MLPREEWLDAARKLDWEFSYVTERDVFPSVVAGTPWLPHEAWADWDEPYRTTYAEYVQMQAEKDLSVTAVCELLARAEDLRRHDPRWRSALLLHSATLPLAEFAAVVGNLRAARFGRDSAWRTMATFGALDELRHTHVPLLLMHQLLRHDARFDWTHRFYHSNNWVALAARHLADELLLTTDPIEFAVGTNFVFETGFTNLQFIGLSALARDLGDRVFEKMVTSIQSDEARHSQMGRPALERVVRHDRARAQYLLDKWFWRSWQLFAVVTGFAMDYLTPLEARRASFREFVEEWVIAQFLENVRAVGLERPWYWDTFLRALDHFHHMVYASAYTYRATVWFDLAVPSPRERSWLRTKYPRSWPAFEPIWDQIDARWRAADAGNDFAVHGTAIVTFCNLCQLVLCGGTPARNSATTLEHGGEKYIFCSEPCRWIFEREPDRYRDHRDVVKRVLAGEAPANLIAMLRHFGLSRETWGKDIFAGRYPFLDAPDKVR